MSEPTLYYDFRGRSLALAESLPDTYVSSRTVGELISALGRDFDMVRGAVWSVLEQFFPQTVGFAIPSYEWENGLPIAPAFDLQTRRSRVLARTRGFDTSTKVQVQRIANSFQNGRVLVIEDPERYTLILRFVDVRGEPPELGELVKAVKEILPWHLYLKIERTYTIWDMIDDLNGGAGETWDQFDARTLTADELETFL